MSNITNITDDFFSITIGEGDDLVDIGMMFDGVTVIGRDIGNSWSNSLTKGYDRYGYSHEKSSLDKKTISITFEKILPQNEMALWRESIFSAVDCPNGPRKLKFNDQPNRYYNAVIDGEIGFNYAIGEHRGTGEIKFLIPDGLAHSTYSKVLTNTTTDPSIGSISFADDGSIVATINNEGSVDAYPVITIKNKVENDYIGIVSATGAVELGNKYDPVSGMSVVENTNKTILNIKSTDSSNTTGWGQFTPAGDISDPMIGDFRSIGGTLKYGNRDGHFGYGMVIDSFGQEPSLSIANWMGGFSKFTIPNDIDNKPLDVTNFTAKFSIKFWQHVFGQVGILDIVFLDADNKPIVSYTVEKHDTRGDETFAQFRRNMQYPNMPTTDSNIKSILFGANNNEPYAQKPNVSFNSNSGQVSLSKNGGYFTWSYNGKNDTFFIPEAQYAKTKYILIGIGRLIRQGPTHEVNTIIVNSFEFVANNISAYAKAPNLYSVGSINTIDMASGNVYYTADPASSKKVLQNEDLVDGSESYSIPKGINQITIIPSTWAMESWKTSKPDISITWVESFG